VSLGAQRFAMMQSANGKDFAALYALDPAFKHQWLIYWCW